LLWSGSALAGQTSKGNPYNGVGLELYANTESFFRYSTSDAEIDVRTDKFFFGNPSSSFISGSNGLIEISSSNFILTAEGDVTASSFIAVQDGNTLFDTNNEFVDGQNIGRIVFFNRNEYSFTGNLQTSPQTASIFETFILPGETNMQYSFTTEYNNADSGIRDVKGEFYIQSAFSSASNPNSNNYYDTWNTPQKLHTGTKTIITSVAGGATEGTSQNLDITGTDTMGDYQGRYVRVYFIASMTSGGNGSSVFKLKGQVFRTSRSVGSSTSPPSNILR